MKKEVAIEVKKNGKIIGTVWLNGKDRNDWEYAHEATGYGGDCIESQSLAIKMLREDHAEFLRGLKLRHKGLTQEIKRWK